MTVQVIYNPRSGGGTDIAPFLDALRERGHQTRTHNLEPGDDLKAILAGDDFDTVVAAGGDGTVSSVAAAVAGRNIPVLAYPAGTGNLVALNLNLPSDAADLAGVLHDGRTALLDLGVISLAGPDGKREERNFILNAGVGFDAALIRTSEPLKGPLGFGAYIAAALANARPEVATFTLSLDGETREEEGIGVMLLNLPRVTLDLPLVNDGDPSDGKFDVIVLRASNAAQLVPDLARSALERLGLAKAAPNGRVDAYRGAKITLTANKVLPAQFDGESVEGSLPLEASVRPRAVPFLVPAARPANEAG